MSFNTWGLGSLGSVYGPGGYYTIEVNPQTGRYEYKQVDYAFTPAPQPPKEEPMAIKGRSVFINPFLIGTDPEFMLLGEKGEKINLQNYVAHDGEIGYDHAGRIAEVRPAPAKSAYRILKNIQRLLGVWQKRDIPGVKKYRAGAEYLGDSLGGHVHIGTSPYDELHAVRVQALDALTKQLEGLDILPQKESALRRESLQRYGRFGDVRVDHPNRIEYRTMASWLYDPKVAYLCLAGAKLAATEPKLAVEKLTRPISYKELQAWFESMAAKDRDAKRIQEKILPLSVKQLQADPDVDFRAKWEGDKLLV